MCFPLTIEKEIMTNPTLESKVSKPNFHSKLPEFKNRTDNANTNFKLICSNNENLIFWNNLPKDT